MKNILLALAGAWLALLPLTSLHAQSVYESYAFATLAGVPPGKVDGAGGVARFQNPQAVVADSSGNVYVADSNIHSIRKVTPAGEVTTFAGLSGVPGNADGQGAIARFTYPIGLAIDAAGNLWVADVGNGAIRKITPAGMVSTISQAFSQLGGIAISPAGNIYVTDFETVRKMTPDGVVTTLAGSYGFAGYRDGSGNAALFDSPTGLIFHPNGFLLVADTNNDVIRFVTEDGYVGPFSDLPYPVSLEPYYRPQGLTIDPSLNVFVADSGSGTIRKIEAGTGDVIVVAGGYGLPFGGADGPGLAARFSLPTGLAFDNSGNLYVADSKNATVRKISPAFDVSTLAGLASYGGNDGPGLSARFAAPFGLAMDHSGNTYVADASNHTIRQITHAGDVSTFAGLAGYGGSTDGNGSDARFAYPKGVSTDAAGNVYVADSYYSTIRKITPSGDVSTLAVLTYSDPLLNSYYQHAEGVASDDAGNLYVAGTAASAIIKITTNGDQMVFAGLPGRTGFADGTGSEARFNHPSGITLDTAGNVYVADTFGNKIRKITPDRVVTTLTGAPFYHPRGVATDTQGNLFFTVSFDCNVRKISPDGAMSIIGGLIGKQQFADGNGTDARFWTPSGIVADASGNIYIADTYNNAIRVGRPAPPPPSVKQGSRRQILLDGIAGPNAIVDLTASNSLTSPFLPVATVTADAQGAYHLEDLMKFRALFYRIAIHVP